jgi:hypothetical protein
MHARGVPAYCALDIDALNYLADKLTHLLSLEISFEISVAQLGPRAYLRRV